MRICVLVLESNNRRFLAVRRPEGFVDLNELDPSLPRDLGEMLRTPGFSLAKLEELAASVPVEELVSDQDVTYRPVLSEVGKVLCLGLNFAEHANETKAARPLYPVVFARYPSSFVGHDRPIHLPPVSSHFDFEAEIAVVIGKRAHRVSRDQALAHVLGYTLMNDGTIRDYQKRTPQWTLGKNFDASGGLGPELVTADELPPGVRGLTLRGILNGKVMQEANTSDMIFDVETAISVISEAIALEPGDVIAMGTPAGVGFTREPPVFLQARDTFEVQVEGIGTLRNRVVAEADNRCSV